MCVCVCVPVNQGEVAVDDACVYSFFDVISCKIIKPQSYEVMPGFDVFKVTITIVYVNKWFEFNVTVMDI